MAQLPGRAGVDAFRGAAGRTSLARRRTNDNHRSGSERVAGLVGGAGIDSADVAGGGRSVANLFSSRALFAVGNNIANDWHRSFGHGLDRCADVAVLRFAGALPTRPWICRHQMAYAGLGMGQFSPASVSLF